MSCSRALAGVSPRVRPITFLESPPLPSDELQMLPTVLCVRAQMDISGSGLLELCYIVTCAIYRHCLSPLLNSTRQGRIIKLIQRIDGYK